MATRNRRPLMPSVGEQVPKLTPAPRSSQEVVTLLKFAAHEGHANTKIVAHLAKMGALFPKELLGAFKAYKERQACDN